MSSEFRFCPRCAQPLAPGEHGGAKRLACACGYVHWDNPVPVVAAIVEHEGAVILARNRDWPEKMFGLITGFLEKGETPEVAVAREVNEELSLDALATHFVGLYPFERRNELIIAYHVPATGTVRLNEELADYRRIAPEKLRPWDFGTGLALRDWLARRGG
ncbi:MAG TPA: NUDIX domain-containing protein [Burkholderiales bacterium]|nr:NUDIX domain-containing protein [Burkholderiales bacterium]